MSRRADERASTMSAVSPRFDRLDQLLIEAIKRHHAGAADEAEDLYRTILNASPDHAVASYGYGLLCASRGRSPEAIEAYRHAIAVQPDFVDAYINLGTAVLALGRCDEAVQLYRQAIAINPGNAMAHGNLGKALQDLGCIGQALDAYRAAINLQPDNAIVHINFGAALLQSRAWADAETVTRRAIVLQPDSAMAYANLGTALLRLGRRDEAHAACRQAISLQPEGVAIHASLGGAMLELGALPDAVALCRHAVILDSTLPDAQFNLSQALMAMNQLDEATLAAREAIALRPDAAEYHFHLAHILLLRGDLAAGWAEYDWRWKLPDFAWIGDLHGALPQPVWTGENIADKTILIYTEQGLGDVILFARYLPLVVGKARRVIVATNPRMRRLLATIVGITLVSIQDVALADFDVHCPLLSLPRAFGTTLDSVPSAVPYLHSDPAEQARWNRRKGNNRLRVGLVWAGNPATRRDRFRSPGQRSVMPLFSIPGIDFVILQVGEDRAASPLPPHVLDLGGEIEDLAHTAAIMSGLDLMISSCTAPLHLAGALNVPTWAMIPFAPYFPWLLERTDTLWYPSVRLYRQEGPGQDWSGVVNRIADDLTALARTRQNESSPVSVEVQQSAADGQPCLDVASKRLHVPATTTSGHPIPGQDAGGFNELARCRGGLMLYNRNDIYIGASLRKYGEFSAGESALFRLIVQPGRTILDVGANIGVHTIDLSHLVGPAGAVHAFEPQRLMFQVLCANVALNSLTNVFAHQVAVGATSDTLLVPSLDPGQRNNYGGLSLVDHQPGERVPLVTIDSLDLPDCQFIKIDVEGMETEALRGAAATIARFRPILYVENDRQARSVELIGLIQQYDYRLYWHLPPLFSADNFRADTDDIFGDTVSVNMICVPAEIPQSALTNLREVTGPADSVIRW